MRTTARLPILCVALLAGACTAAPATPAWTAAPALDRPAQTASAMVVEVYKSPTCSCCHEWEAYMHAHGWTVRSMPVDDMTRVKVDHGVPMDVASCHTAIIDGYVVEGHVPLAAIEDLLRDRPAIDGIALPGMPAGSPGMPGMKAGAFQILALDGGEISAFGSY
jgi:hypothetical protein